MDFSRKRTRKVADVKLAEHTIQQYSQPPTGHVTLQEFEDFAIDRLKVLKVVEQAGMKHVRMSKEWTEFIEKELRILRQSSAGLRAVLQTYVAHKKWSTEDLLERRKDLVSHFILRLAYCRSEDLRRWFIQQEVDLFRFRFGNESRESRAEFMIINEMKYEPISEEEKRHRHADFQRSAGDSKFSVNLNDFYRVPFTDVLDLVRSRRVFIEMGYAFIPTEHMNVLLCNVFRAQLSKALAMTSRALPALAEDNRLEPLLRGITKRYLGDDYGNKKRPVGVVTADMIDQLCKESFPLCMSNLHTNLRSAHHLKHGGRQQYGLFLKGIGLSLEEALRFWRSEFTRVMDGDKFQKQYTYNIRHNYGQEGKRADYTSYSCMRIITSNQPGAGDHHGCPFKHWDAQLISQRLQALRIDKTGHDEVMEKVKRGEFQVACGRLFYHTHRARAPEGHDFNPNHPNQFYEESRLLLDPNREVKAPTKVKVVMAQRSSQGQTQGQSQAVKMEDNDFDDDDTLLAAASQEY